MNVEIDRRNFLTSAAVTAVAGPLAADAAVNSPVVKEAARAAFNGGGKGLVISRKYSEMKLANLAAVSDELRELKIV